MKLSFIDVFILARKEAVRLYQSLILYDNIWKILTDLLQDSECHLHVFNTVSTQFTISHKHK